MQQEITTRSQSIGTQPVDVIADTGLQGAADGWAFIDLTDSVTLSCCQRWLSQALLRANGEPVRRLVLQVMSELEDLGSTDGELNELVVNALGSVQTALELQDLS